VIVALAPVNLVVHGFFSMNAVDVLVWEVAFVALSRTLRSGSRARWLGLGALLGIGLLNKISTLWLGLGLFAGLLSTPHRAVLRSPWPWAAAALAACVFLPHVLWQVAYGWPTADFMRIATTQKMLPVSPLELFAQQVLVWNPLALPVWAVGFIALLRRPATDPGRVFAIVFATTAALLIASGTSRPNYLALAVPPLVAAGAIAFERVSLRPRWSWLLPTATALIAVVGLALSPLTLPILPAADVPAYAATLGIEAPRMEDREVGALDPHFADMHGWEAIVDRVAEVYHALPAAERAGSAILVPSYSEAGAIDLFGAERGLPTTIGTHNSYWLWGPGRWDGSVAIIAGGTQEIWERHWGRVEAAAVWNCGYCLPGRNHSTVWIARDPRTPLEQLWPALRHYR
jgi:hypothetical protein